MLEESYVCSIYACLVLSISSSSWCLGRAAVCDCGTPWTFLLPVFEWLSSGWEETVYKLKQAFGQAL